MCHLKFIANKKIVTDKNVCEYVLKIKIEIIVIDLNYIK